MWQTLKNVGSWISTEWGKFEAWVYSWMPGFKTRLCNLLGALSAGAAALQGYITGLPLDKFATGTQIAILTAILFTLAYWFHGMGDRVDARTTDQSI